MVFFNCNACGESLKKNQVEKHYQFKCKNCEVLSCMDCGKEFWGNSYQEHTKCISEEEKYSGKDFKPKPGANKGEAKQEQWTQMVREAVSRAPANNPKLRSLLERLDEYPNIPRKKTKFENFLKNSLRVYDQKLASQVWDTLGLGSIQKSQAVHGSTSAQHQHSDKENQTASQGATEDDSAATRADITGESETSEKKLSKREKKELRQKANQKKDKKRQKAAVVEEENSIKQAGKKRKHRGDDEEEDMVQDVPKKAKKKKEEF